MDNEWTSTANNLVDEAKNINGAVYRRIFALAAQNQRMSIEICDLKNESEGKDKLIAQLEEQNKNAYLNGVNSLQASYKVNKSIEPLSLGHLIADKKSQEIAHKVLPNYVSTLDPMFERVRTMVYAILRNE